MSFFRYPGGKAKLREPILDKIQEITKGKEVEIYAEPFFGGGSICSNILKENIFPDLKMVAINDRDPGIYALWHSVVFHPFELMSLVKDFTPSIRAFYFYKAQLETETYESPSLPLLAFKKLAVHQMSYSGLGVKAGGPIGGLKQESKYDVGCRWSTDSIIKKIDKYHQLLNPYETLVSALDFSELILIDGPFFLYLDPPYFVKGNDLYHMGFTEGDHYRLSDVLQAIKSPWLLSYDDCPEIRELYDWAEIDEVSVNYSITTARNKNELLIYSKQ